MLIAQIAVAGGGPSATSASVASKLKNLQRRVTALEAKSSQPGPQGAQGVPGPKGDQGLTGLTGATGPTYGESHGVFAEAFTAQMDMGPASTTVTTPTSGKLYVFGYNQGANVTCTSGTGVYVGLFVDNTRVPGLWSITAGVSTNLVFQGVTSTTIPAGSHTVVAKAQCLSGTVNTTHTDFGGYGVILLGS